MKIKTIVFLILFIPCAVVLIGESKKKRSLSTKS